MQQRQLRVTLNDGVHPYQTMVISLALYFAVNVDLYVNSATGSDENTGASPTAALVSLEKAQEISSTHAHKWRALMHETLNPIFSKCFQI